MGVEHPPHPRQTPKGQLPHPCPGAGAGDARALLGQPGQEQVRPACSGAGPGGRPSGAGCRGVLQVRMADTRVRVAPDPWWPEPPPGPPEALLLPAVTGPAVGGDHLALDTISVSERARSGRPLLFASWKVPILWGHGKLTPLSLRTARK